MPVGHEDVAIGRDRHIGRSVERVGALAGFSGGAERHQKLPLSRVLEDLLPFGVMRAAVCQPEEAIPVDTDAVSPDKHASAPRLQHLARCIEFDDVRFVAVKGEDATVGVNRHPRHLAPGHAGRKRSPPGHELVRLVGERRRRAQGANQQSDDRETLGSFHGADYSGTILSHADLPDPKSSLISRADQRADALCRRGA